MNILGRKHLDKLLERAKQRGLNELCLSGSVKTNWIVFTGTYSSGKTTLVQDVAESASICFAEEPARAFIEKQLQTGRTNEEIWADVESTVMPIHELRLKSEKSLEIGQSILLDTAIPDTLAYAVLYGVGLEEIIRDSSLFRYTEPIFLVEPLPFQSDETRKPDSQERFLLHYLRKQIYINLGYHVVSVPVLGRTARRDFVLRYLREKSGNL